MGALEASVGGFDALSPETTKVNPLPRSGCWKQVKLAKRLMSVL